MRDKKKYCLYMMLAMALLCAGIVFSISFQASAAGAVNNNIDAFKELQGDAGYINVPDNYYLDMEDTDLLETGYWLLNSIANLLFTFIRWLANVVVTLFYQCMTFDMAELFKDQIDAIQETLNSGIFQPLFLLGFCGCAIVLLKKMLRRDLMGAFGQILKVVGIVILSFLVVRDSATVLSAATGITKSISAQAMVGMQGNVATTDFAAESAGVLWVNLIHQPWKFIEFGEEADTVTEEEVATFLSLKVDDDKRKEAIKSHNGMAFNKGRAGEKIGFMFLYLIPFVVKSLVYILLALLTLVFQLIAVFYVVLAPVVLILAMVPGYEGLLGVWLRKILESQLSILIMSFIIGLLVKVDQMLFDMCAVAWGWLVVMIVQTVMAVFIILKKDQLIGALSKLQKGAASPGYAKSMLIKSGDGFSLANRGIKTTRKAAERVYDYITAPEAGSSAGKRTRKYQHSVIDGNNGHAAVLQAGSYEPEQGENGHVFVERPSFSRFFAGGGAEGRAVGFEMEYVSMHMRMDAYQTAPEPHTEVLRPRMDNAGADSGNVQFAYAEEQRERVIRRAAVRNYRDNAGRRTAPRTGRQEQESNAPTQPTQERYAAHTRNSVPVRIRERQESTMPVQRPQSSVRRENE